MTTAFVIGAEGFLGSAFVAHLRALGTLEVLPVVRATYDEFAGREAEIVVDCSGNSRKYLAEDHPQEDFHLSVTQRLRTLRDFPAALQLHVSSVDVYETLDDPAANGEDVAIDPSRISHYGFHKLLAEQVVRHYARSWLIIRLGGMVGPALRKNPIYDVLHHQPLRIHPDSRYQFLSTADAARIAWALLEDGLHHQVINICGDGLISPREVAALATCPLDLSALVPAAKPRILNVSIAKLRSLTSVPRTEDVVRRFLRSALQGPSIV